MTSCRARVTQAKAKRIACGTSARSRDSVLARIRDFVDFFAASSPARFAILIFTGLVLHHDGGAVAADRDGVTAARPRSPTRSSPPCPSICVTGLSTVDMATHWSTFGNVVILIGLEVGGIGVLTLASMLGLDRLAAASASAPASWRPATRNPLRIHHGPVAEGQAVRLGEIGGLLATVAISVLTIELALTALITPRLLLAGADPWRAIWEGFYFATSAFTNTGFVPHAARARAVRHRPVDAVGDRHRRLPRQPRVPGDLRAGQGVAHAAPLVHPRETHPGDDARAHRARRRRALRSGMEQPEHARRPRLRSRAR